MKNQETDKNVDFDEASFKAQRAYNKKQIESLDFKCQPQYSKYDNLMHEIMRNYDEITRLEMNIQSCKIHANFSMYELYKERYPRFCIQRIQTVIEELDKIGFDSFHVKETVMEVYDEFLATPDDFFKDFYCINITCSERNKVRFWFSNGKTEFYIYIPLFNLHMNNDLDFYDDYYLTDYDGISKYRAYNQDFSGFYNNWSDLSFRSNKHQKAFHDGSQFFFVAGYNKNPYNNETICSSYDHNEIKRKLIEFVKSEEKPKEF